jgi:tryptophan synthase alpha chain
MTRIGEVFKQLKEKKERALITYITAGDPDMETTEALIRCLAVHGADIIELGIPFSDPMADGPTIQLASQRALARPFSMESIFELVAKIRKDISIPIILFGYYNPFYQYGLKAITTDAKEAGVDGFLVVDLPPEEAIPLKTEVSAQGLDLIFLLAPTSTKERMTLVAKMASGFIYYVSVTGVTGAREKLAEMIEQYIIEIKKYSSLPIGVGFGISKPEHVRELSHWADAVIVGSAIIKVIENNLSNKNLLKAVGSYVASLKEATRIDTKT